MKLYRINNWEGRYEVTDGGGAWNPGQKKRKGPLQYIRLACEGSHLSNEHRRMTGLAGLKDCASVYGVWCKLLELAGEHDEDHRGAIWVRPGTPATARDIADMVDFGLREVRKALEVLSRPEVGWLLVDSAEQPGTQLDLTEIPGNSTESPGKGHQRISDTVLKLPCRGKVKEWRLTRTVLIGFIEDYPSIDCLHQVKRARGWLEAKIGEPEQWTSRGVPKGLKRWLAGEEDGPSKDPQRYHSATKDERWQAMRAIFPDWEKAQLMAAVMTAKEVRDVKRTKIRDAEDGQARAAQVASTRGKGQPTGIGELIEKQAKGSGDG